MTQSDTMIESRTSDASSQARSRNYFYGCCFYAGIWSLNHRHLDEQSEMISLHWRIVAEKDSMSPIVLA